MIVMLCTNLMSTSLHYPLSRSCWAIKIATVDMGADRITANIMVGVHNAVSHIQGKWKNIQAIHLHSSASGVSLPIYQSFSVATEVCLNDGVTVHSFTRLYLHVFFSIYIDFSRLYKIATYAALTVNLLFAFSSA